MGQVEVFLQADICQCVFIQDVGVYRDFQVGDAVDSGDVHHYRIRIIGRGRLRQYDSFGYVESVPLDGGLLSGRIVRVVRLIGLVGNDIFIGVYYDILLYGGASHVDSDADVRIASLGAAAFVHIFQCISDNLMGACFHLRKSF